VPSPGPPPTGQRDGRGRLWPHGSSSPPLPGHLWPKGATPHWPEKGREGDAFARPSPDWPPMPSPPHQPIEAFGREASPTPRLTHWPKGPPLTGHLRPPTDRPRLPHSPDFRERWPKGGGGVFACIGCRYDVARVPYTPFGAPLSPTPPIDWPPLPHFPHLPH